MIVMGYSVYVIAKNEKLNLRMYNFLKDNLIDFKPNGFSLKAESSKLNYCHLKDSNPLIGFNYGAISFIQRKYIFAVTMWIAIKIGKRFNGKTYYWHDGSEKFIVEENSIEKLINEDKAYELMTSLVYKNINIRSEINKMEEAWIKRLEKF